MNGLRGAIMGLFGFTVAVSAALVVLPIALLLDPATRRAGAAFVQFGLFHLAEAGLDDSSAFAAAELARFLWSAVIVVCVLPLALTALLGAAARVHALAWYAGATGVIAAAAPWIARAAFGGMRAVGASAAELRFALVFFLTGAASGLVFWLIAGRAASERRQGPD